MGSMDPKTKAKMLKNYEDLLEAAFDNEVDAVVKLLDGEPKLTVDPSPKVFPEETYSVLSEAAAGNALDVARLALDRGGDPNHKGQYNRTPLYRACFNEHEEVIPVLLEGGADPRTLFPQEYEDVGDEENDGDDAQTEKPRRLVVREWNPEELPVAESMKKILRSWDISKTVKLLEGQKSAATAEAKNVQQEYEGLVDTGKDLQAEVDFLVSKWRKALELRESRIREYDTAKCERNEAAAATLLPLVQEAEAAVAELKATKEAAEAKLSTVRGTLRKHEVTTNGLEVSGQVSMANLPDVAIDSAGEIWNSGKCALLVDPTEAAATFLKYGDCVMVDSTNPHQVAPHAFVEALLGSIKNGRTFIVNVGASSTGSHVTQILEAVQPGLSTLVLTNQLTSSDAFFKLLTPGLLSRTPELKEHNFTADKTKAWRFMVLTTSPYPEKEFLSSYHSMLVQ